jgi:glycosyltransferase involved in cell wall biosynthesis
MKVLHVIASVDRRAGGPIEGVFQLAAARAVRGGETHIVSLDRLDDPWVANCPFRVFPLGISNAWYSKLRSAIPWLRYGYTPKLVPWLRYHAREYDVVIVNGLWNYAAFGARRALGGNATPYVVFAHGMLDPWFRKTYPVKHRFKQLFWWFSEGPLLANARATLFTTEEERVRARDSFWPYRLRERVVGYGTADIVGDHQEQITAFRAAVPALGERKFLLFLSRIHRKKGCDLLIDAFAKFAPANPDFDLVIAGPDQEGWEVILKKRAHALGIADRIHWPGMLTGHFKWGAFRACEAFVLPSHQENFGIVVAEAMAASRPVLITNKVNVWREVQADGAGLVANDDGHGILDILDRYFALPQEERTRMGLKARECFLRKFEIESASASVEDALHKAITDAPFERR